MLEKARAHAAAERIAQNSERILPRFAYRETRQTHANLNLSDILLYRLKQPCAAFFTVNPRAPVMRRAYASEALIKLVHKLFPFKVSRAGDYYVIGRITPVHISEYAFAREALNRFLLAEYRSCQRISRIQQPGKRLLHEILGYIARHMYLLDNHALFAPYVIGIEPRIHYHIGKHVDRKVNMLVKYVCIKACAFLCRKRVKVASDGVHLHRYILRAAAACPLKEHVLYEVSYAVFAAVLVDRAGFYPRAYRHRAAAVHPLHDDAYSVIKFFKSYH